MKKVLEALDFTRIMHPVYDIVEVSKNEARICF